MGKPEGAVVWAEYAVWAWLGSLAFLIAYRLLNGRIELRGLLQRQSRTGVDPAKVQLVVLTVTGAFFYLGIVLSHAFPRDATGHPTLPDVPDYMLAALGGGNVLFLAAKGIVAAGWLGRRR